VQIHITKIVNGDVYGHQTAQCDASGCAVCEHYFSGVSAEGLAPGDVVETEPDPDAYDVCDYDTGEELEGLPTLRLVRASLAEYYTGAVCATYDAAEAQWDYVPSGDRDRYEARGERVRTVFVREAGQ
jgi:hypothetical protein